MATRACALLAAMVMASCGGASSPAPEPAGQVAASATTDQAAAMPKGPPLMAEVVAIVDLPSGTDLGTLPELVARLMPGVGSPGQLSGVVQMLVSSLLGNAAEGVDMSRPMRLVLMNPKKLAAQPLVLVAGVADAARLSEANSNMKVVIQGDYALIGDKRALAALGAEDVAVLSVPVEVDEPEVTVLVRHLVDIYRDEIAAVEKQLFTEILADKDPDFDVSSESKERIVGAMMRVVMDCDRVIIRGQARGDVARISARVAFAKNSQLAAFARAQAPYDAAMLGKLPATRLGAIFVATFRAGPFHAALNELLVDVARTTISEAAAGSMGKWADLITGSMVMNIDIKDSKDRASVTMLEVTDADAIMRHSRAFTGEQKDVTFTPRAFRYQGVEVDREISTDKDKGTSESFVAAVARHYIITDGQGADAAMRGAIDAARGKGKTLALTAPMQAALSRSRARKDSMLMVVGADDLGASVKWQPGNIQIVAFGLAFGPSSVELVLEFAGQ